MIWIYAIGSVIVVSLVSLLGITLLSLATDTLRRILSLLVSGAAGALFGDVFIHLIPEIVAQKGFELPISLVILFGIIFFFVIEKYLHWRHCHKPEHAKGPIHPIAIVNLISDGAHNMLDGLVIGASYLVSIPVGIATTIAVFLHEIPQEVSDFGILLHGGFTKGKAIFFNFLISLSAIVGVMIALSIGVNTEMLTSILMPFAAGGFIYIAGADLIPELHKETDIKKSMLQLMTFLIGIGVMALLLFVDTHG